MFSSHEIFLIERLLSIINEISSLLSTCGKNIQDYPELKRAKNILKNKDAGGMKNITKYLYSSFRMIDESAPYIKELSEKMDEAYIISDKHTFLGGDQNEINR